MNSFLQSKNWLDFQKSLGRKVWQIDSVNIIKHNLPLGKSYFYSPRTEGDFLSKEFLTKLKKIADQENAIFFKIEPQKQINENLLKKSGFIKGKDIQPRKTLILDITKTEEELLNQMHYKTRYNIRLAEKKGVEIRAKSQKSKVKNFEEFWRLLQQTAKRGNFRTHPKEYYKKMLEIIPETELFIAEYQNRVIAANIVIFYQKTAIYLHGASDYQYRNLMAPHLLQWKQVLEAKRRGCIEYDFWGIDEKKWPGVTRFKKGFGGKQVIYPGAYDLVFQPVWYRIYRIAKKIL